MKKLLGMAMGIAMGITVIGGTMAVSAAEPEKTIDIVADEIGIAEAEAIALKDAGLTADGVEFTKMVNEFEDGKFVYSIEFIIRDNKKYEYKIDALTGKILDKDNDDWEAEDTAEYKGLQAEDQKFFNLGAEDILKELEKYFQAAVKDAGVAEGDIQINKYGVDFENGKVIFDTDFFIPGNVKYDYDTNMKDGSIVDRDKDVWEAEDNVEYQGMLNR